MALGKQKDRLSRLPVFACLDADALHLIAFSADIRKLANGEALFHRGDSADGAILVVSGAVVLEGGPGHAAKRVAGPGTLIDESALLAPGERSASAIAREASSVIAVSRNLMLRVLEAYPSNAEALRHYWARRLGHRLSKVRSADR